MIAVFFLSRNKLQSKQAPALRYINASRQSSRRGPGLANRGEQDGVEQRGSERGQRDQAGRDGKEDGGESFRSGATDAAEETALPQQQPPKQSNPRQDERKHPLPRFVSHSQQNPAPSNITADLYPHKQAPPPPPSRVSPQLSPSISRLSAVYSHSHRTLSSVPLHCEAERGGGKERSRVPGRTNPPLGRRGPANFRRRRNGHGVFKDWGGRTEGVRDSEPHWKVNKGESERKQRLYKKPNGERVGKHQPKV